MAKRKQDTGWTRAHREQWIDELERSLFPHQESEEEQESFTPEGRKRAGDVIDRIAAAAYGIAVARMG